MKVVFEQISLRDLKPLISFAFYDDPDLLTKYSLLKTDTHTPTLEESVEQNYQTISEAFNLPIYNYGEDVRIYDVRLIGDNGSTSIGFTVTLENEEPPHILFSFGININYRDRKTNAKWLEQVKAHLGKIVCVTLHNNNTRAINYLVKNGFTPTVQEEIRQTTLISNYNEFGKVKAKQLEVTNGS